MLNNNPHSPPAIRRAAAHSGKNAQRERGMTLIELIVVCTIALILLSIGVPSFQTMTQNNRLATETNKMISSLLLARSEAVKRRYDAKVCYSTNSVSCADDVDADFRLVFFDENENGAPEADEILRVEGNVASNQEWGGPTSVSFTPDGMINNGLAYLKLTDDRKEADNILGIKCIRIAASGRPSVIDADPITKDCPVP